ncbi:conserved Plasmodium protein, unknown function [Plasmodium ovale]|uniref:VHS domain-containing protein n=1 Tax=Plasmodium ovale TaxID=36330 RepID=A0A1C3L4H1_PLAOA|nr:conserved Plasmodium protein, unknown function [Plasmodium ovale]
MDNGGIRKRKDAKDNNIKLYGGNDAFIKESSKNNTIPNNNKEYANEKNVNWMVNRNITGMSTNRSRDSSSENSKSGKKKSISMFNSSNISTISNNCMKSFNNIINSINYNINSSTSSNNGSSSYINSCGQNNKKSGTSPNNSFYENQIGNLNLSKGINYLSNIKNAQSFFGLESSNKGKGEFNFFRNYENNLARAKANKGSANYATSGHEGNSGRDGNSGHNGNSSHDGNNGYSGKCHSVRGGEERAMCGSAINSTNLESFLSNKEIQNDNYKITGFGNSYTNEINNLRNITNDDTYCTCLDNLLRNHGNIDSNEMLKYNDKNINCLNDIIFLDVYRAYNILTYMQEKINIIIYTIKIIGKKLKKKHLPEEVVISLEFLNFCVKNLGLFFVRFIDESFMKKISALLKTTTLKKSITKDVKSKLSKFLIVPIIHPGVATDPRLHFIKRKILFMLQLWHDSFILHQHIATAFFLEYKSLKEKGITFPIINKTEKFFVKNAEMSPSFSDDNILHDLPLNLTQINNIMKSLKEIKNMYNSSEKSKCINIISKYKDPVLQSINKLSDYKGNINISVTLNSLLYINDQICIFEKIERERQSEKEMGRENERLLERENEKEMENERKKKKKKIKKKENAELANINEIIFNKFDPWNTEKKETNEINEINQSNDIIKMQNTGKGEKMGTAFFEKKNNDLYNDENVFSLFGEELDKNAVNTDTKENIEIEDKYSVFNELNFNNDTSSIHASNNYIQEQSFKLNKIISGHPLGTSNMSSHIQVESSRCLDAVTNRSSNNNNPYLPSAQQGKENFSSVRQMVDSHFDINFTDTFTSKMGNPVVHTVEVENILSADNVGGDNIGGHNAGGDNAVGDNAGGDNVGGENSLNESANITKNDWGRETIPFDIMNSDFSLLQTSEAGEEILHGQKINHGTFTDNALFNRAQSTSKQLQGVIEAFDNHVDVNHTTEKASDNPVMKSNVLENYASANKRDNHKNCHVRNSSFTNENENYTNNSCNQEWELNKQKECSDKDRKYVADQAHEKNYDHLFETFDFSTNSEKLHEENKSEPLKDNAERGSVGKGDAEKVRYPHSSSENEISSSLIEDKGITCSLETLKDDNALNGESLQQTHKEVRANVKDTLDQYSCDEVQSTKNKTVTFNVSETNKQKRKKKRHAHLAKNTDEKKDDVVPEPTNNEAEIVSHNNNTVCLNYMHKEYSNNMLNAGRDEVNDNGGNVSEEGKCDVTDENGISELQGEENVKNAAHEAVVHNSVCAPGTRISEHKGNNSENRNDKIGEIGEENRGDNEFSNQQDARSSSESNDLNFDEFDEITKAIDDLNDNFENMNIYKYDN